MLRESDSVRRSRRGRPTTTTDTALIELDHNCSHGISHVHLILITGLRSDLSNVFRLIIVESKLHPS
jgi:hypothetical protein